MASVAALGRATDENEDSEIVDIARLRAEHPDVIYWTARAAEFDGTAVRDIRVRRVP